MPRSRALWAVTLLLLVPAAVLLSLHFAQQWSLGILEGQPWFHPIPPRGAWIPWIHPPGYAEFMHAVSVLSDRLWVAEGFLIFVSSGVVTAGLVALFAAELGPRVGAPWAWYGSLLLLLSSAGLRPFEHYPLSKGLATLAVLMILRFVRTGGRAAGAAAFGAGLASVMLHLSCWFVVGPAFAAAAALGGERRRPAALLTAGLVGVFLLLGFTGLYELIGTTGPAQNRSAEGVIALSNVTYEWNDPWLWAPLALWALPAVREGRRDGAVVGFGMVIYCAITFAMMWQALVIGGQWVGSHHYLELIDGLACFAAALALGAAWKAGGRLRGVAVAGAVGLGAVHVRWWLRAIEKLEELARHAG